MREQPTDESVVSAKNEFYYLPMEEVEKKFRCPYCHQKISMMLDVSIDEVQSYIEDCEVCCRPIQLTFSSEHGKLTSFSADAT